MQAKNNTFVYVMKIFLPLLLICAAVAGIISGLQVLTKDQIKANEAMVEQKKEEEKLGAIAEIYGAGASFTKLDLASVKDRIASIETAAKATVDEIRVSDAGSTVTVTVKGYAAGLQVFVAFGEKGDVRRVMVIASNETTGIGSKVSNSAYLEGYVGQSGDIAFGSGVDKIAGASISSKGVLHAVNTASDVLEALGMIGEGGANE